MRRFRDLPIKHKLTLLVVLTSASALIVASAAFLFFDIRDSYDDMVRNTSTQAKIIGYNSAATILFFDPQTATQTLSALSTEPDIMAAGIYDRAGKLFASYTSAASTRSATTSLPAVLTAPTDGHRFKKGYLELSQKIVFEKRTIGAIVIQTSTEAMRKRVLQYVAIALLVLIASTAGSILVSLRLQRRISQPILELVATAKSVSRQNEAPVSTGAESRDEVGLLVKTFHEMLARIQVQSEELREANEELENRVLERTTQLEAANKELEAFSYSVSHDLRAPLRSIDGFSQALFEDQGDKLDEQGRSDLQRVRAATQRMARLIDDLLNLSRVSRSEMRRESVDLSALVKNIAAELQAGEPDRQVALAVADGLRSQGDPRLLRVLLENLLRNAWKFTGKHATAKIEFGTMHNNGRPIYYVRDDGAGFDMAYAGKLFGAFQRLHAMTEFHGTGIGLATVQRIVHRHGGRVWAEGKVDHGATFYFTL